ncbi:DUF1996 domain-containing protein [Streptomyces sp. H51]|uniref:DUF1996 domain-containing protein n=1 Tax=Streptomyces sp. H51 TaxID=3111770 RepID=UPI002D7A294D|nr:DUF1996 domain-containing protein [Streptomyces sp. H51]
MGRSTRRRPTGPRRATFAAFALILGGGGLVGVNVYASATEGGSGGGAAQTRGAMAGTIDCPDVGARLTQVPDQARADVDKELALLDQQTAEAYQRLQTTAPEQRQDSGFADNAIMNPLKEKRAATIERIAVAIDRVGDRPAGLDSLAACTLTVPDAQAGGQGPSQGQDQVQGQDQGQQGGGQAGNGPVAADFVDITEVQPNVPAAPRTTADASTGSFTTRCGVNADKNYNTDNVIVAPGVTNGAHHTHDYVGNQKINAFSSNDTFLAGGTSCENKDDLSSYYWPVLRLQDGTQEFDQNQDGGGKEGNVGRILTAQEAEIKYVGSPTGKVVAMPQFLRIITGDAKTTTNGLANANAHWSCTGFEDEVRLTEQYPICPQGSKVVRSFAFQSCWDGRNTDSANHRTHVAFADASGNCGNGFKAIPQLTMRLVYDVPAPTVENGQVKNPYAVDGFPEQLHKAATDHDDFISITTGGLAQEIADCVNSGRQCGSGADGGAGPGSGGGASQQPTDEPTQEPTQPPADQPTDEPTAQPSETRSGTPSGEAPATQPPAGGGDGQAAGSTTAAPRTGQADGGRPTVSSTTNPRVYATSSSRASTAAAAAGDEDDAKDDAKGDGNAAGDGSANGDGSTTDTGAAAQSQAAVPNAPVAAGQSEQQAVQGGGLAETGTTLWPAAAGTVLLIAGLIVLARSKRRFVR